MRLTLRTLLAYLDDRLSPGNARELGQKIVQSPFATELADRIKSVVRRRRLANDSANQKNIDANLIAEYLDDQLTPELVALIEKEILGSDHNLAEVAAAHQILGLLSDPVEISDRLSERLYKLDPTVVPDDGAESASVGPAAEDSGWKPLAPQTTTARRSPMLLLLLMILGWLALLFSDANLFQKPETPMLDQVAANAPVIQPADGETALEDVDPARMEPADAALVSNPPNPTPTSTTGGTPPKPVGGATTPQPTAAGTLAPTAVAAAMPAPASTTPASPANSVTPAETAPVPQPQPSNGAAASAAMPAGTAKPGPAAGNPPQKTPVVFQVRDPHRMLVLHEPENEGWIWANADAAVPVIDWGPRLRETVCAVADPFRVTVSDRGAGWSAIVRGPSLFRAVNENGSGIELFEGELVLQSAAPGEDRQFVLVANGHPVIIRVPEGEGRVGIQVVPQPTEIDGDETPGSLGVFPFGGPSRVTVYAADDELKLTIPAMERIDIVSRGRQWIWNTVDDAPQDVLPATASVIPEWVYDVAEPLPNSTEKLVTEAAQTLRSESTVSGGASDLSTNRNPQLAAYGVHMATLIRNVDQLTAFLVQPAEKVVRVEAISGLQKIIQQSNKGRDAVRTALETRLSNAELDNALKMLEGVSRVSAEDRFVSGWLVEMLESNRVALREMAIVNLTALTQEHFGFVADDEASRRTRSVRRWKSFLDRNDGRLIKPVE